MNTRSHNHGWWIGPAAVSLACFTLVWQGWVGSTELPPLVVRTNGLTRQFPIPRDETGFQEFCESLVQQVPPAIHGNSGLVAWRNEVAAIYAAREKEESATKPETDSESVMRLASTGGPQSIPKSESVWAEYWTRQSRQASDWLDRRKTAHQKSLLAQAQAAYANRHRVGLPPAEVWVGASWCGILALLTSVGWLVIQPPRRLNFLEPGNVDTTSPLRAGEAKLLPPSSNVLTFQSNWLRVAQPTGVHVRRFLGAGLVMAAILVTLRNLIG